MKNLLAENMLRFGPKNLSNEHKMRLRLLQEQSQANPFANDDESVKSHPLYTPVTNWWIKNSKDAGVIRTLKNWGGQQARPGARGYDQYAPGIKRLKDQKAQLDTLGLKNSAIALQKVITWIDTQAKKNVYIDTTAIPRNVTNVALLKFILRSIYAANKWKTVTDANTWKRHLTYNGIVSTTSKDAEADIAKKLSSIDSSLNNYDLSKGGAATGFVAMTSKDKLEALNFYQERANAVVESGKKGKYGSQDYSKITTAEQAIAKASKITVRSTAGAVEKGPDSRTVTAEFTDQLTWPDPDADTAAAKKLMETMFVDDAFQISDSGKAIYNYIYNGLKSLIDKGATIKRIGYAGFASTSKVRTSFTGQVDAQGKAVKGAMSMDNNKLLADARANSIQSYLKTCIDDALSKLNTSSERVEAIANTVQPNLGPEWESVDDLGPAAILYNQAKQNNPNLTPQQFYGARKTSELKAEYNAVYGPFRKNFGFVEITGTITTSEEELTPSFEGSSGYTYRITWKGPNPPRKKKPRGSLGGGQSFVGVTLNTTACPFPKGAPGWWQNLNKGN